MSGTQADIQLRTDLRVVDRLRASSLALDVLLVAGVALGLGLIRLGAPSLWFDEAYTFEKIKLSFADQIGGYQPIYYWMEKPWTSVVGTSEWALRFPSVAGAMLASGLLVVLARRFFDRWVALLAGLFLAASPFFVKWSQQARGYTFVVAACLLATLLLLRALDRGSRGAWALYGGAYSVVLVLHAVAGLLLVPAHAVLAIQRRQRLLPHGLVAAIVIVVVGVPWVAQLSMRSGGEGTEMDWLTFPSAGVAFRALLDVSGASGLGVLLALVGLGVLLRGRDVGLAVWLATWAFAPFALALLVSTVREIYLDRYLLMAAPAFALLAAVGVMGVRRWCRAPIALVVIVATSVGLAAWFTSDEPGNWRGEDWRGAVAAVTERRGDGDAMVVVPWWAHDAPEYYGADITDVARADSVWVLSWSETGGDVSREERRALGFGDHRLVERLDFGRRVSAQLWKREP